MTSYRPITDMIICARSKVKYYGAYPSGFLRRAKWLMPGGMLHLFGGHAADDPFFGPQDETVDTEPMTRPTYLNDVMNFGSGVVGYQAVLADPPYTEADAAHYGDLPCPNPNEVIKVAWGLTVPGGRCGLLHYVVPRPPDKSAILVAVCGVMVGFGNRIRVLTVFEKPKETP
ncbi:MAG: hypothetical protein WC683_05970 [bacterium]